MSEQGFRQEELLADVIASWVTQPWVVTLRFQNELITLRNTAANAAAEHGLAFLASGTHPTANWRDAVHSPKERYRAMMQQLQMVGQRDLLCGMHVHVELPDPDRRINRARRMLSCWSLRCQLSHANLINGWI
jgi:carboxylate-amine ligase